MSNEDFLKLVLTKLIKLAKTKAGARSPFIVSDLVDQDSLGDVQNQLSHIMMDVATLVPGGHERIIKELPYVFKAR
jgi:hypothetical protein